MQYTWPEFVAADLSQTTLKEALSGTSWDKSKRTMFIIEGLVSYQLALRVSLLLGLAAAGW